jgi:O-antigen ligase
VAKWSGVGLFDYTGGAEWASTVVRSQGPVAIVGRRSSVVPNPWPLHSHAGCLPRLLETILEIEAQDKLAKARGVAASQPPLARALHDLSARVSVSTWRAVGLALMLFSATIDRYTLEIAGLHAKAEHIAALGLLAVFAVRLLRDPARLRSLANWRQIVSWPLVWLVPYVGVTLLSSTLNAPDVESSVVHTALVALAASSAALVYWLADSDQMVKLGVRVLILLGLLEAGFTFAALAVSQFGLALGTQQGNGKIVVPHGTLWEPNLLGSYLAASGVLLLSFLFVETGRRRQLALTGGLLLILMALSLSLARASWVGFFVGAGVVALLYFLAGRVGTIPLRVRWARSLLSGGAAVALTLAFLPTLAPLFFPSTAWGVLVRVNPNWYDPTRDPSVQERVSTTRSALDGIADHPIIGNGAGSYGVTHTGEGGAPGWISNLELHILYDSGVVGLLVFAVGLGLMAWRGLRRVLAPRDEPGATDLRPHIIGLLGALAVLLLAFQATEGTWMAFFWVYVGLLASAVRGQGSVSSRQ